MQRQTTSHAKTQPKPHAAVKEEEPGASKHEAPAGVQSVEPADPALTGGGHASQKNLLEENLRHAKQHPATPAGQHATGSFTGKGKEQGGE